MIVCPTCNHHNPEGAEACAQCGASLAGFAYRACPTCGALNAADSVFCHRCLSELSPGELELSPPLEEKTLLEAPPEPRPAPPAPISRAAATPPREEIFPQVEDALEGLENILPHEVAVSEPHRASPRLVEPAAPGEARDARLFGQIAAETAPLQETARVVLARPARGMAPWLRRLLYLLVLLAAVTPLITGGNALPWVRSAGGEVSLVQNLSALPQEATVLLVFDYTQIGRAHV
jgi:ribosomal protein L40E